MWPTSLLCLPLHILLSCLPLVTESGGCELIPQQKDPRFDSGAWVHPSSFIPIGQSSSQQYIRRLFFLCVVESLRRRELGSPFLSSVWGLKVMADRTQLCGPWGYLQRPNNKVICAYTMMRLWSQSWYPSNEQRKCNIAIQWKII